MTDQLSDETLARKRAAYDVGLLALLFHVLAWLIDGRQVEQRRTDRYLLK